jgi:hypothetical protein
LTENYGKPLSYLYFHHINNQRKTYLPYIYALMHSKGLPKRYAARPESVRRAAVQRRTPGSGGKVAECGSRGAGGFGIVLLSRKDGICKKDTIGRVKIVAGLLHQNHIDLK